VVGVRGDRIAAVVGGQHEQIARPEQLEPLPHATVDLAQRAVGSRARRAGARKTWSVSIRFVNTKPSESSRSSSVVPVSARAW